MSFATLPISPVVARFPIDWRQLGGQAAALAVASLQSATFAAVLWLIVAAPGLLG